MKALKQRITQLEILVIEQIQDDIISFCDKHKDEMPF